MIFILVRGKRRRKRMRDIVGKKKNWVGIPTKRLSLLGLDVELGPLVGDAAVDGAAGGGAGGGAGGAGGAGGVDGDETLPEDVDVKTMEMEKMKEWMIKLGKKSKGKKISDVRKELLKYLPDARKEWASKADERKEERARLRREEQERLDVLSESIESYRTHAHSCVVKGREKGYKIMMEEFIKIVEESDKGMDHMLEDLLRKERAWNDQVEKVVKTCLQ